MSYRPASRKNRRRFGGTGLLVAALASTAPPVPSALAAIFDGGGDGISWNDAANWDASGVPDTTTETAVFANTDVGAVNLNIAGTTSILAMSTNAFTGTWNIDLQGNTLRPTAATTGTEVFNSGLNNASGTLNISNGTFQLTDTGGTSGIVRVGTRSSGSAVTTADVNITAGLGSSVASAFQVGHATTANSTNAVTAELTFDGSGSFVATGAADQRLMIGTGNGAISTTNLTVTNAVDEFRLVGSSSRVVIGQGTNPGGAFASIGSTVAVNFTSSADVTEISSPVLLTIGTNTNTVAGSSVNATVDLSGSASATITGSRTAAGAAALTIGSGFNATGSVTLGTSGLIRTVTNAREFIIGDIDTGSNAGGSGLVTLNRANLEVGSGTNSFLNMGKSGDVVANITDTSSGVTILSTTNTSDSFATTGALRISDFTAGDVRITLNFDDPNFTPTVALPYWGFRWAGTNAGDATTKATALATLINEAGSSFTSGNGAIDVNIVGGSSLVWADFTVGTYLDGVINYAFIGFTDFNLMEPVIPEPASAMLLAAGAALLTPRQRRERRRA